MTMLINGMNARSAILHQILYYLDMTPSTGSVQGSLTSLIRVLDGGNATLYQAFDHTELTNVTSPMKEVCWVIFMLQQQFHNLDWTIAGSVPSHCCNKSCHSSVCPGDMRDPQTRSRQKNQLLVPR
jgi:hypothetical protein